MVAQSIHHKYYFILGEVNMKIFILTLTLFCSLMLTAKEVPTLFYCYQETGSMWLEAGLILKGNSVTNLVIWGHDGDTKGLIYNDQVDTTTACYNYACYTDKERNIEFVIKRYRRYFYADFYVYDEYGVKHLVEENMFCRQNGTIEVE